ncbi:hypothetical protein ABEY43_07215 [Priestia megaterium]
MLSRKISLEEITVVRQELLEYAFLKHELSNGEDREARRVIKAIQTYDKIIKDAYKMKIEKGHIRW